MIPMDETLVTVAMDFSMRPCLVFQMKLRRARIGTFDPELVEEFFKALATMQGSPFISISFMEETVIIW